MNILIAYASKHGSTQEIAEFIGAKLSEHNIDVDVQYVGAITHLAHYDAVVVGSAVYAQQWRPDAAQFIKLRSDILAEKPVWIFSSGPTGHGTATELLGGFIYPEKLHKYIEKIAPEDIVVFHGKLDLAKLTLAELMIVNSYGGPIGDYRQWDVIAAWAEGIAHKLGEHLSDSTASV